MLFPAGSHTVGAGTLLLSGAAAQEQLLPGLLTPHLVLGSFLSRTCCWFIKACGKKLSCAHRLYAPHNKHLSYIMN